MGTLPLDLATLRKNEGRMKIIPLVLLALLSSFPAFADDTIKGRAQVICPSSEFFGMLRPFCNGGSGSVSV